MSKRTKNRGLPFWIYREIDLTGITSPKVEIHIPIKSFDYVIHRLQASYDSDLAVPSNFSQIEMMLNFPSNNRRSSNDPIPVILSCNPGINDRTSANNKLSYYYESPLDYNWPVKAIDSFTMEFKNIINTGIFKLLIVGNYIA